MNTNLIKQHYTFWKSLDIFPTYNELLKISCHTPVGIVICTDCKELNEMILITFINNFNYLEIKIYHFPLYLIGSKSIINIYDKNDQLIEKINTGYAFKKKFNNILIDIANRHYNNKFVKFCYTHEILNLIHGF